MKRSTYQAELELLQNLQARWSESLQLVGSVQAADLRHAATGEVTQSVEISHRNQMNRLLHLPPQWSREGCLHGQESRDLDLPHHPKAEDRHCRIHTFNTPSESLSNKQGLLTYLRRLRVEKEWIIREQLDLHGFFLAGIQVCRRGRVF